MKTISLRIEETVFGETERIVAAIKKPRNRYINDALRYYNAVQKRRLLENRLHAESLLVKENSMAVLKEYEGIEDER
ncbi:MAG: hypothetical protein EHM72_17445 [Calditrichaeota bacterium]|nr:MAG: hypothetical protein EHM72_17445 [Calditrichota bacterium]